MKKTAYALLTLTLLTLSAFVALPRTDWKIADGFTIAFSSEDPSGSFTRFNGDISFDPQNLETSVFNVRVDPASISTGNGMKNKHARSDEWLDVERYPDIRFVSAHFRKTANGFEADGTLDLHGIKKTITIPFTFENNTFAGEFTVNRTDYNIGKTKGMSAKVSKELKIRFSVPVTRL